MPGLHAFCPDNHFFAQVVEDDELIAEPRQAVIEPKIQGDAKSGLNELARASSLEIQSCGSGRGSSCAIFSAMSRPDD